MARLQRLSAREAIGALERLGFVAVRQRGSHLVMKRSTPEGTTGCVVPLHDELAIGTLRGVLRQGNVSVEDFLAHL
ncbi:type II toxin-antitoxin system HicA family toxin [bacterium]|nr:type II toxin-antitoxin system HicA family toxin [bacterium]